MYNWPNISIWFLDKGTCPRAPSCICHKEERRVPKYSILQIIYTRYIYGKLQWQYNNKIVRDVIKRH